ncbi:MAG: helix-turn-helix transcriptional regulator [Tissierellaceae bacterium]|nr:helix-turn-helix transcriptional regulator [Tissierellaceae bacterium]
MKVKNLKEIRISKNILQKDAAEKSGISGPFYSLIEMGLRNPSIDTAKSMATSLGITLDEFYESLQLSKEGKI